MSDRSRFQMHPGAVLLVAIGLIALGSAGTYVVMKRSADGLPTTAGSSASAPMSGAGSAPSDAPLPDVTVMLSAEAVKRAGIEVATVMTAPGGGQLRVPAVVQPNAYRSVVVTPLVAGRITRVSAELGQQVRRGQTLAEVYSPELAEAQTRYVSSRAELDAHERELRRTERLVEIGAESRQELEKIHAEHTAATTMVQSHRARLTLLGMSDGEVAKLSSGSPITATTNVPAPLDGVVTARQANVGLNVEPAVPLFTVVDLSTVWLEGNVHERDLAGIRIGSSAMVTTTAFPERMLEGKVSYIDPQIQEETRTAHIRVEVPNPGRQLRLGMYAELQVGEAALGQHAVVPRSAVQIVGDRSVVYLVDPKQPGRFIEREVQLGQSHDDLVEVTSGVTPGDTVVTKGSFSVRAERERLGVRPAAVLSGTVVVQ